MSKFSFFILPISNWQIFLSNRCDEMTMQNKRNERKKNGTNYSKPQEEFQFSKARERENIIDFHWLFKFPSQRNFILADEQFSLTTECRG